MTTTRYQRGSIRVQHGRVYGSWRGEPGPDGKRKRMSVYLGEVKRGKSKADWRDALRTHLDRYYQGLRVGVPVDATLRVFVEGVFLPAHQSAWAPNTSQALIAALRKHVLEPLGERTLTSIIKADIVGRLTEMRNAGYKVATIRVVKWLLYSIFEEAADNDLVPKNPTRRVKVAGAAQAEQTRPLTEAEVHKIYTATEGAVRLWWRLAIGCGMRPGEVAALRRNDVGSELRIDEAHERGSYKTTKTRKVRFAPLPASLAAELQDHLAATAGGPADPLLPDPWGRPMSHDWMRRYIQIPVAAATGIADLTLRQARTTCATLLRADVADVAAVLGHATARTTLDHYRRTISDRQVAAAEELDKRLVGGKRKRARVIQFTRSA